MTAANDIAVRLAFEAIGVGSSTKTAAAWPAVAKAQRRQTEKELIDVGLSQTRVDKAFSEGQSARP